MICQCGFLRLLVLASIFLLPIVAYAENEDQPIDRGTSIELTGIDLEQATGFIVDRTITNFGTEFLRQFSIAWRTQPGIEKVDLTVVEKPSARWGSTIIVEYNNHPVAKVFLQAGRSSSIKPLAIEAALYIATKVADQALMSLILRDPDLGKEELP